jgi:SpoVK/Ycf46/Vps4 family AAA+-type ATPase
MKNQKEPFYKTFQLYIRAGYSAFQINSSEENRVIAEINRAGSRLLSKEPISLDHFSAYDLSIEKIQKILNRYPGHSYVENENLIIDPEQILRIMDNEKDPTEDEQIFINIIIKNNGYTVVTYDTVNGFTPKLESNTEDDCSELSVMQALKNTISENNFSKRTIFIFKDINDYLSNNGESSWTCLRLLREILENNLLFMNNSKRRIVLLQAGSWVPPVSLQHCLVKLDFNLPDTNDLIEEIDKTAAAINKNLVKLNDEDKYAIALALRGLTQNEAANALALCTIKHGELSREIITTLHQQKAAIFNTDGSLEYVDDSCLAKMEDIAGYDNFLDFISESKNCYTAEAIKVGIRSPKGVLLLGIPGTGKSVVATAAAKFMQLPLIKYNFGSIFQSLVGESEELQKRALNRIKAQGPCVVLIDEADKLFGGIIGSGSDGGVGQRILGHLLSWMANENQEAFIIMSMNRLINPTTKEPIVPVELIRAGRIDAVFYTDFPGPSERNQIFKIHMRKNGANWENISENTRVKLIQETDRYVGSEIEQICIKAVRTAWSKRNKIQPIDEEVIYAKNFVNPVAKLDQVNTLAIRDFCRTNGAIPVHKK